MTLQALIVENFLYKYDAKYKESKDKAQSLLDTFATIRHSYSDGRCNYMKIVFDSEETRDEYYRLENYCKQKEAQFSQRLVSGKIPKWKVERKNNK